MLTCEYIAHSGFIFETKKHILFFDVASGTIPAHYVNSTKEKTFFVSHYHCNHFNANIVSLNQRIIASLDVPLRAYSHTFFVKDQDNIMTHDLAIKVFKSTDVGVCFLVNTQEGVIFHAGDFNYWHWKEEVSQEESELAHLQFKSILEDIIGHHVDVACFPCDQRMGQDFDLGPLEFIQSIKPKVFCAMHHQHHVSLEPFAQKVFELDANIQLFLPSDYNQKIVISMD